TMPSHFCLTSSVKKSVPFSGKKPKSGVKVLICCETFPPCQSARADFSHGAERTLRSGEDAYLEAQIQRCRHCPRNDHTSHSANGGRRADQGSQPKGGCLVDPGTRRRRLD